jgi:hypothetical protein
MPREQRLGLAIHLLKCLLDVVHFVFLEERFTALGAYPCWHGLPGDMVTIPIRAERGVSLDHLAFAMEAFHFYFLVLKSGFSFSRGAKSTEPQIIANFSWGGRIEVNREWTQMNANICVVPGTRCVRRLLIIQSP